MVLIRILAKEKLKNKNILKRGTKMSFFNVTEFVRLNTTNPYLVYFEIEWCIPGTWLRMIVYLCGQRLDNYVYLESLNPTRLKETFMKTLIITLVSTFNQSIKSIK